ncbi:MAG TPA: hypothetical protein VLA76_06250 [Candidatus Angelobacter sp.]|nr:hypothetical protein [Candidatus Angelobacter sp.]
MTGILELPDRIASLEGPARARADGLLDVRAGVGRTEPPAELESWLARTFGSVAAVREQQLLKVTNRVTLEATLFAPLRQRRPVDGDGRGSDLAAEIAASEGDPFCEPELGTPAETFGRVRRGGVVSGANAALADVHHAVLVFDRHDPLAVERTLVADVLAAGREWAERAHATDPDARAYLLIWNCLWRAGGSIVHGHAQALLGRGPHYARPERWRRDAASYRSIHRASLADDLVSLHRDLGLAVTVDDVALLAHVTPVKEREILVVGAAGSDERDPGFVDAVTRALLALRDQLGVRSFNLALWRPPLGDAHGWEDVGPMVRIVDRGDLASRASDIGAMELYGTPVVGTDPYDVAAALT